MGIFNLQDLTGEFSILDIVVVMLLRFVLSAFIGWIYKITHRGSLHTQSFVITLVMMIVGALSIIRFRNAVKETCDVGFNFWRFTCF
jgi:hypothetical protein